MSYADDDFYKYKYLLGRNPVIMAGFAFYARSASQIMDRFTFDRLKGLSEVPAAVPMCCCELAEAECRKEKLQKESGGKTSEKLGTYSVSFASAQDSAAAAAEEQRRVVIKWLGDTGLCYQGVD